MKVDRLVEMLETYSNAVLGFVVLQSLAFAFTFGTNARFSCIVKNQPYLASGLVVHFVASTALACIAIGLMARTTRMALNRAQPVSGVLLKLSWAKVVVAILFASIPVFIVGMYGRTEVPDPQKCDQVK